MRRIAAVSVVCLVFVAGCGGTAETTTTTAPATTTISTAAATTTTTTTAPPEPESTTTTTTTTAAVATGQIEIVGDDEFVAQAGAALELLATETPDAYSEVSMHIDTIESVSAGSGMDVFSKTFMVGDVTAYAPGYESEDQVLWLAGTIVHDACHSRLYTDGEEYIGRDAELACLIDQLAALEILSGFAFESYISSLIEGVDDPANDYWNDPNRHW